MVGVDSSERARGLFEVECFAEGTRNGDGCLSEAGWAQGLYTMGSPVQVPGHAIS